MISDLQYQYANKISGRDLPFKPSLFFVDAVILQPIAALEQGDALAERLLEFDQARLVLIQSFCLLDVLDVGEFANSKKDTIASPCQRTRSLAHNAIHLT